MIGMQLDAPFQAPADRDALQLMRELFHRFHLTALQSVQHQKEGSYEREGNRHTRPRI